MNTQTSFEEISGLKVLSAGKKTATMQTKLQRWRTLPDFALVYIIEGHGYFDTLESHSFKVKSGDCLLLLPGVSHYYGPEGATYWKEFWVIFRGGIADGFCKKTLFKPGNPVISVQKQRQADFQQVFEFLIKLYHQELPDYELRMASSLYTMLLQLVLPQEEGYSSIEEEAITAEMKYILQTHISSNDPLHTYFYLPRIPYNTLRIMFQKITGQSPGTYLQELRLRKAEEQLIWTNLPIKKISMDAGYEDPQYFSRLFKLRTGVSPSGFREAYYGKHIHTQDL